MQKSPTPAHPEIPTLVIYSDIDAPNIVEILALAVPGSVHAEVPGPEVEVVLQAKLSHTGKRVWPRP